MSVERSSTPSKERVQDKNPEVLLQQLLDSAREGDPKVFDHLDSLETDKGMLVIDEYFKEAIMYSGESEDFDDPALLIIPRFLWRMRHIGRKSYHAYIAQKMIESGRYGMREYLQEPYRFFNVDHDILMKQVLASEHFDLLKEYYPHVPPHYRARMISNLIESPGFSISEKEVQTPTWNILVQELVGKEKDPWFTLNIIFIDKNGNKIDIGALLPEDWVLMDASDSAERVFSCDRKTKTIRYPFLSERSWLVLLHEIGHAHYTPRLNQHKTPGKVRSERHAWAWALQKVRELKREGVEFPESVAHMKNIAYTALRTYDRSRETDAFTKNKKFEEERGYFSEEE